MWQFTRQLSCLPFVFFFVQIWLSLESTREIGLDLPRDYVIIERLNIKIYLYWYIFLGIICQHTFSKLYKASSPPARNLLALISVTQFWKSVWVCQDRNWYTWFLWDIFILKQPHIWQPLPSWRLIKLFISNL